jgi:hypothetical protein
MGTVSAFSCRRPQCALALALLLFLQLFDLAPAIAATDWPRTPFEKSEGVEYTSLEKEWEFLREVATASPRVALEVAATTEQGRPIYLVRIGHPVPTSPEASAEGRSLLFVGGQHGNEPAGREMSLILLRDLAFTDDPDLVAQLSQTTVLVVPTANPDGRAAQTRGNSRRIDPNRDHLALSTIEGQTLAMILRDYTPLIVVDAHEGPSAPNNPDQTPRLELSWPRNLNVDPKIRALSEDLVERHLFPTVRELGYTARVYGRPGGAGGGAETIFRNMVGLRHSVGLLIETFTSTPLARVELQTITAYEVLRFHRERSDEIASAVAASRDRARRGDMASTFNFGGSDWDEPSDEQVVSPVPCGYLINSNQSHSIARHLELFPLKADQVSDQGVFLPVAQTYGRIVPLLLDPRAARNLVEGRALADCSDPGAEEPPQRPRPGVALTAFFSESPAGTAPEGWREMWSPSDWKILGDPLKLRHRIDSTGGRRALVWEGAGPIEGDVEVLAKVRGRSANTLFQLPIHVSGEAGREDAYYVDMRKADRTIRINRYLDGEFSTLGSASFDAKADVWYLVRFRRQGENLMVRGWAEVEEEPSEWHVQGRDDRLNGGTVGLAGFQANAESEWSFLSIATAGETATESCQHQ